MMITRRINIKLTGLLLLLVFNLTFSQRRTEHPPHITPNAQNMRAGAFIDVNATSYAESNYTIEQLVKNVLIQGGSNCDQEPNVSNVTVSPNLSATNLNRSWGYFNKGTTNFPFDAGVLLITGYARDVGNTIQTATLSKHLSTGTDVDLAAALGQATNTLADATYIEFDFVPVSNEISFNYIFASEEYAAGTSFPCTYTDSFALLLKKQGDANYTNLAVLPNGGGIVSVTNIHPFIPQGQTCNAVNEEYFGGFNTANIETNLGGRTVPLTAVAQVTPGETYHFKMVIADSSDGNYDSAVFLQAGSFNIGIQFVDENNATLPNNVTICEGTSQTLTAQVDIANVTFQWSLNGNEISGATSATYVATQGGTYSVEVITPGSACATSAEITITSTPSPEANDSTLSICSTENTASFNLTSAQGDVSSTAGATFTYYENLTDANAGNTNNINTPTAYNSGGGTVYVLVKKDNCSAIAELTLSVNEIPETPTITASETTICGTGNVTLTSSATTGNVWSTGETTSTITVTEGGTYTLSINNGNCTSEEASVTITKTDDPNLQITGETSYCAGDSTTLTATANGTGNTFLWSDGTTTAENTINTAGTYTVTITTDTGCEFSETINITENPTPEVQNANLEACDTGSTATFNLTSAENTISTSAGATFAYYTNQADANAGNTNNINNPAAYNSATATMYVRVSIGNCFKIAELQLTHTTTPTATITASGNVICDGNPITLTSNYTTGNVWSTGETTPTITVNTAGNYTLTVSNGNCVSETVNIDITANDNPNIQITGNTSFCAGDSTTLTANTTGTGLTFLWSNGATAATNTVNQPGTYTVTVTTSGGCEFTESVTVTQDGVIDAEITQPQEINCTNPNITLDASGSTIESNATIVWTASGGGNIVSGGNTLTPTVDAAGTYTLTITSTEGNLCSDTESVTVIANVNAPTITLSANTMTICEGQSLVLTASGGATYTWTGGTTSGNGSTQTISPTTETTYTVTGVGANGCQGNTATITISVVPAITSTIENIEFCKGESGVLDAGTGNNYTYQWSNGETTPTITVTDAGIYNVTINNGVCSETYAATVSYTPVPVIQMVEYNDSTISIVLAENFPNAEYSIDGGLTWQTSPVFVNVSPNVNYNILVRQEGVNCYSTTEFYAFNVSNLITPNNDGHNDEINFSGVSKNNNFSAIIYDRYGKVVFRGTPTNTIWNGTYIGFKLSTGTYWYHITWEDPISKTMIKKEGWIMLKNREN